jgi:hypothetical protein
VYATAPPERGGKAAGKAGKSEDLPEPLGHAFVDRGCLRILRINGKSRIEIVSIRFFFAISPSATPQQPEEEEL